MANQMIALGVRGPQLPNLGAAAAQMGNVMANMAVAKEKQAGVQRANAFRQLVSSPEFDAMNPEHIKAAQALDPAGAEKLVSAGTSRRAADLQYIGEQTKQFRDVLAIIDPADPQTYAQFQAEVTTAIPGWARFLPAPEQWNANTKTRLLMKADDVINKTISTPTSSAQQDAEGNFYGVTVGGLNPPTAAPVTVTSQRRGQVEMGPQETVAPGVGGPMEMAPQGRQTLGRDIARILATVPNEEEYQAALSVVERADPTIARQIRAIAPRFDPQALQQIVKSAEDAFGAQMTQRPGGLVTGERGGMGGPLEPGVQFRGKPPLQSPAPGTNIQTLPRIAGEASAQEGGKQNVRVTTEPKIAGGTKAAELRAQRDDQYPEATSRMKANLARIDTIIETARALQNHPAYRRIIGPIDAFTPNITGGARAAQELFKTLSSLGAVDELQKMRQESPTGGAVGNASDADITLLREGFGALGQSQDETDFDNSLKGLINRAMQTRRRIADQYRDTYNYRLPKGWTPPAIAKTRPQPQRKETRVGSFIVSEAE